jgi:hypothetical protein
MKYINVSDALFSSNKTSQQYHSAETPAASLALAYQRNKFNINFSISKNSWRFLERRNIIEENTRLETEGKKVRRYDWELKHRHFLYQLRRNTVKVRSASGQTDR